MISTSRMTTDRVLVGFFLMPEPDPRTLPVIQPGRGFHVKTCIKKKGNFIYCYWFFLVGIKAGVIVIELGIKSYMYDVEQKISVIKSDCVSFLDWQSNLEKFEKVLYHLSAW